MSEPTTETCRARDVVRRIENVFQRLNQQSHRGDARRDRTLWVAEGVEFVVPVVVELRGKYQGETDEAIAHSEARAALSEVRPGVGAPPSRACIGACTRLGVIRFRA